MVKRKVCETLWNGWTTKARFQKKAGSQCLFGCRASAEDCIEHYCCCPVVEKAWYAKLRTRCVSSRRLSAWMLAEGMQDLDEYLTSTALIIYGTYRAFNLYNTSGRTHPDKAYASICQYVNRAVEGHSKASIVLNSVWSKADGLNFPA